MDFSVITLLVLCLTDICSGNFLSCPSLSLKNGRIKYSSRRRAARFVCRKHFQLYGSKSAACVGGQWSQDLPTCIANRCTMLGDIPTSVIMIPRFQGALLLFSCHDPSWSMVGNHEVYCDGQKWSSYLPHCIDVTPKICDFEESTFHFCGWRQDSRDDFDWTLASGSTATADTGPPVDHTYSNTSGHYIYIETSHPRRQGDTARLISPLYQKESSHVCLEFFYHMTGNVGKLEIFLKPQDVPMSDLISVFSKEGNQGKEWNRGYIFLGQQNKKFQVIISASKGQSYRGDIAIDDLRLNNCEEIYDTTTQQSTKPSNFNTKSTTETVDRVTKPNGITTTATVTSSTRASFTDRAQITLSITSTKLSTGPPVPHESSMTTTYLQGTSQSDGYTTKLVGSTSTPSNQYRTTTLPNEITSGHHMKHRGQYTSIFPNSATNPSATISGDSRNDQMTNQSRPYLVNMKQSVDVKRQESVKKNSLYIAIAAGSVLIIVLMVALILTLSVKSKLSNRTHTDDEFNMTSLRKELNQNNRFRLSPLFSNVDDENNVENVAVGFDSQSRDRSSRKHKEKSEKSAHGKKDENNFQSILNRISYIDEDDDDSTLDESVDCRDDDEAFFS